MKKRPLSYAKIITQHKITIPIEIREHMKLKKGDYLIFNLNDDGSTTIKKSL